MKKDFLNSVAAFGVVMSLSGCSTPSGDSELVADIILNDDQTSVSTATHKADSNVTVSFLKAVGRTSQPIGHYELCKAIPDQCKAYAEPSQRIQMTDALWGKMDAIHNLVNAAVYPESDIKNNHVEEYWDPLEGIELSYPVNGVYSANGDCEDYAMKKKELLKKEGFPESAMSIVVAVRPDGEGHAVLAVHTNEGDYILDNMERRIFLAEDADLTFIKKQSSHHSGVWVKVQLEKGSVAITASNPALRN